MSATPCAAKILSGQHAQSLLSAARTLGDAYAVQAAERDAQRRLPHAEMQQLAASGILAARVPREQGGPALSVQALARIFVDIARGDPNIAQAMQPHACGVEKIKLYGDAAQQAHFLGLVLQGQLITNASAERGGGTIGEIHTTLTRTASGWELNGTKHYCTGSLFAGYLYVLCLTQDALHPGHDAPLARARSDDRATADGTRRIQRAPARSLAIVPVDRAGIRVLDDWNGMGQRTTASGTVIFDAVRVAPLEHLPLADTGTLRTHEGAFAQILHAAIDAGIALAALHDAARYGREKARSMPEAHVSRASDDPYMQHAVGEMAMLAHAAQAMVDRGAAALDEALSPGTTGATREHALGYASVAVAEAKMAANEASLRVSEMLYRVGGAAATSRPLNLDRHWRNARTHTTHDPVAYKARAVGDFYLNGVLPPINTKI